MSKSRQKSFKKNRFERNNYDDKKKKFSFFLKQVGVAAARQNEKLRYEGREGGYKLYDGFRCGGVGRQLQ